MKDRVPLMRRPAEAQASEGRHQPSPQARSIRPEPRPALPRERLPAPVIPPDIAKLLGPAPLLSSESKTDYHAMMASFAVVVDPKNFIEWEWVKDLTDLMWQIRRWRLIQTRFIEVAEQESVPNSRPLPINLHRKSPFPKDALIASQKPSWQEVQPFRSILPTVIEIERLIENAEKRRRAIIDDVERYRFALGQKLKKKAEEAETIDVNLAASA